MLPPKEAMRNAAPLGIRREQRCEWARIAVVERVDCGTNPVDHLKPSMANGGSRVAAWASVRNMSPECVYGAAFIAQTKSRPVEHVEAPLPIYASDLQEGHRHSAST